jgi:hypothetical protein
MVKPEALNSHQHALIALSRGHVVFNHARFTQVKGLEDLVGHLDRLPLQSQLVLHRPQFLHRAGYVTNCMPSK